MSVKPFFEPILKAVTRGRRLPKSSIVTVTGHSLGGAKANAFATILKLARPDLEVHLITFGSPRIGGPIFVKTMVRLGIHIIRFVNGNDVVSQVPTHVVASW